MLLSVIKTECIKLRRAPIWIAFFIFPLLAALMGTFNYLQNIGILTKEWDSLWTQHTLFSSFFFLPSLLGLSCAYQWRLEHRTNNWYHLMTQPILPVCIFTGKLIVACFFSILTLVFTGLLYYLCGRISGLTGFPKELPVWILFGILGSVAIVSVQLFLSMVIKSFAVPIGIALVGGIVGLLMANQGLWMICPYSLIAIGMNANGNNTLSLSNMIPFFSSSTIFTLIAIVFAVIFLKKKDI